MMNKIKFFTLLLFASSIFFIACDDDDISSVSPQISIIYSNDDDLSDNTGFPHTGVAAEGINLTDIATIVFDNTIDVIFNPALNSDVAIFFEVPFDEALGSRFGLQDVTFTNKKGRSTTTQFNILQPLPIIRSFTPDLPDLGSSATIIGDWLQDVVSVTYNGENVEFTEISGTEVSFIVPTDITEAGDVIVETTTGFSEPVFYQVNLGFSITLVSDFDGGGLRTADGWQSYGDADSFNFMNDAESDGDFAELVWAGNTADGYVGTQSAGGDPFLTEIDPYKVKFIIEMNGNVGANFDVYLNDGDNSNWAINFIIEEEGWQTYEAVLADFGKNYDPSNQDSDPDPSQINLVKVGLKEDASFNPTTAQFDNIRFNIYEEPLDGSGPPPPPENLLLNGDLELGSGDDFDNWGKWNGADRMIEETTDIYEGARALKLINPEDGDPWSAQFVSDVVTLEVGELYTISMQIKGESNGGIVRFSTNEGTSQYGPNYTVNTAWQLVTWEITATDAATRVVLDLGTTAGTYVIDDIQVVLGTVAISENLALNGSLEAGSGDDFDNWGKWNGGDRMTSETTAVFEGARALKVINPEDGDPWSAQFVSDEITMEVDALYTISMWIKGDSDGGSIRFSTNEGTAQYGPNYTVTTEWQKVTWQITATGAATRIVLDLGASAATYYIDDIWVLKD